MFVLLNFQLNNIICAQFQYVRKFRAQAKTRSQAILLPSMWFIPIGINAKDINEISSATLAGPFAIKRGERGGSSRISPIRFSVHQSDLSYESSYATNVYGVLAARSTDLPWWRKVIQLSI
jgi:hypothetical protein